MTSAPAAASVPVGTAPAPAGTGGSTGPAVGTAPEGGPPQILYVSFNQDNTLFALGTTRGFNVTCSPLRERYCRDWNQGIGIVEVLIRSNILALVGGGPNPKFPPTKVMIWDDYQNKCLAELESDTKVTAVKLRRDRIVVADTSQVVVYNFSDIQPIHIMKTFSNPMGVLTLSVKDPVVVATLGAKADRPDVPGVVLVEHLGSPKTVEISAHEGPIACVGMSQDGRVLATASAKGTLVRVWDPLTGAKAREVRRGADQVAIHCIAVSPDNNLLAVTSSKGTCHLFHISENGGNRQSSLKSVAGFLPSYFSSEWSVLQFPVPTDKTIIAFGPEANTVVCVSYDGTYTLATFSLDGVQPTVSIKETKKLFQ